MTSTTRSLTGATPERPGAVASYGHMLGLVGIAIVVAALGALAQAPEAPLPAPEQPAPEAPVPKPEMRGNCPGLVATDRPPATPAAFNP